MQITWEKYGKYHVGYDADTQRVLYTVMTSNASDGAPCELHTLQMMRGMYLTVDAAIAEAEQHVIEDFAVDPPPVTFSARMLSFVNAMARAIEAGALDSMDITKPATKD